MFYWLENIGKEIAQYLVKYAIAVMENHSPELC